MLFIWHTLSNLQPIDTPWESPIELASDLLSNTSGIQPRCVRHWLYTKCLDGPRYRVPALTCLKSISSCDQCESLLDRYSVGFFAWHYQCRNGDGFAWVGVSHLDNRYICPKLDGALSVMSIPSVNAIDEKGIQDLCIIFWNASRGKLSIELNCSPFGISNIWHGVLFWWFVYVVSV